LSAGQGQPDRVAVFLQPATPAEVAPVIMAVYGLTEQERVVTGLVCQGLSTGQIAARLVVSGYTVQDHLKSVFDKTGVRSRRELVATILRQHYLPGQARPPSRPRWLLRLTSRPADCMAAHALTCTSLLHKGADQ
jgi:DNA-binding CsgD family transcriptional regulator